MAAAQLERPLVCPARPSAVHMGPIRHARVPGHASALLSGVLHKLPASSGCNLICWVQLQLTHSSGWVGGAVGSPALLLWVIIKDIGRTLSVKAAVLWTFTSRDPPGLAPSSPGPRVCHTGLVCAHIHASARAARSSFRILRGLCHVASTAGAARAHLYPGLVARACPNK